VALVHLFLENSESNFLLSFHALLGTLFLSDIPTKYGAIDGLDEGVEVGDTDGYANGFELGSSEGPGETTVCGNIQRCNGRQCRRMNVRTEALARGTRYLMVYTANIL
jgi:hypothetical protein